MHCTDQPGRAVLIEVETLTGVGLDVGAGYGGDPDWGHGQWKGETFAEGTLYDLTGPAVTGRRPFSVVDHVARATCEGAVG